MLGSTQIWLCIVLRALKARHYRKGTHDWLLLDMPLAVKRLAIVGTGVIGTSWISLALKHGLSVDAFDPARGAAEKSRKSVEKALVYLGCKDIPATLLRLRFFDDLHSGSLGEADFVQEVGLLFLVKTLSDDAPRMVQRASKSSSLSFTSWTNASAKMW